MGSPGEFFCAVSRLERAHAHDLGSGRHVSFERSVFERHRRIARGEHRRCHAFARQVFHQLEDTLDAGSADWRKCVRHDQRAQGHGFAPHCVSFKRTNPPRPATRPAVPSAGASRSVQLESVVTL